MRPRPNRDCKIFANLRVTLYCVLCRRQVESITSDLTSSIISELSLSQANYSQLSEVRIVGRHHDCFSLLYKPCILCRTP